MIINKAFILCLFIFVCGNSFGQKVKFKNLNYKYTIKKNATKQNYIDTIFLYAEIEYKTLKDIENEINYVNWYFGILTDSIVHCYDTRITIRIINNEFKFYVSGKNCENCNFNNNILTYKIYLGEQKFPPNILFVTFDIEYNQEYHIKYHQKKTKELRGNVYRSNKRTTKILYNLNVKYY